MLDSSRFMKEVAQVVARVKARSQARNQTDFVESLGPAFLAHLLRRISDELVEADRLWHAERGVANPPRTSSTLLALERHERLSVTELAQVLRQSHQLVKQWLQELQRLKLIVVSADRDDRRRSIVTLSEKGRVELARLKREIVVVARATEALVEEAAPGLIEALWAVERDLRQRPFVTRIRQAGAKRSRRT